MSMNFQGNYPHGNDLFKVIFFIIFVHVVLIFENTGFFR